MSRAGASACVVGGGPPGRAPAREPLRPGRRGDDSLIVPANEPLEIRHHRVFRTWENVVPFAKLSRGASARSSKTSAFSIRSRAIPSDRGTVRRSSEAAAALSSLGHQAVGPPIENRHQPSDFVNEPRSCQHLLLAEHLRQDVAKRRRRVGYESATRRSPGKPERACPPYEGGPARFVPDRPSSVIVGVRLDTSPKVDLPARYEHWVRRRRSAAERARPGNARNQARRVREAHGPQSRLPHGASFAARREHQFTKVRAERDPASLNVTADPAPRLTSSPSRSYKADRDAGDDVQPHVPAAVRPDRGSWPHR